MIPAFGVSETKALLPYFASCAAKVKKKRSNPSRHKAEISFEFSYQMSTQWKDMISTSLDQSALVNIPAWLSRATLDAIGEGNSARLYYNCH